MSILRLVDAFREANISVTFGFVMNESLITRARNDLAAEFLATDCEYLLWLDSDHAFEPADILKMIKSDKDIIGAVCATKSINWDLVRKAATFGLENLEYFTGNFATQFMQGDYTFDPNEPLEVNNIGTGIMLVKRNVFETLKDHVATYRSNNNADESKRGQLIYEFFATSIINDELYSEDYYFCNLWRGLGNKVYAAPWVQNAHIGPYEFRGSILARGVIDAMTAEQSSPILDS